MEQAATAPSPSTSSFRGDAMATSSHHQSRNNRAYYSNKRGPHQYQQQQQNAKYRNNNNYFDPADAPDYWTAPPPSTSTSEQLIANYNNKPFPTNSRQNGGGNNSQRFPSAQQPYDTPENLIYEEAQQQYHNRQSNNRNHHNNHNQMQRKHPQQHPQQNYTKKQSFGAEPAPRFTRMQKSQPQLQQQQNISRQPNTSEYNNNGQFSFDDVRSHQYEEANRDENEMSHSFKSQLNVSSNSKHPLHFDERMNRQMRQRNNFNNNNVHSFPNSQQNGFSRGNFNRNQNFRNQFEPYHNMRQDEKEKKTNESQREIMDDLLRTAAYECIVCCDMIKISQKTWNCTNCYNVFHLKCIQTWARTSNATEVAANANSANNQNSASTSEALSNNRNVNRSKDNAIKDWRCPTCQNVQPKFPYTYFCFCGQVREPEVSNYRVPHSCGDSCSRPLSLFNIKGEQDEHELFPCAHKCTLPCHPGKCAPCTAKIERTCACTKTRKIMNCVASKTELICDEPCGKVLNCGKHYCERKCHYGNCDPCEQLFDLKCFCGKEEKKDLLCSSEVEQFLCEQTCGKLLGCGFHTCTEVCHPGPCGDCQFDPATLKNCPCGKTKISAILGPTGKSRLLCIDPIPVCGLICAKRLKCGSANDPHYCKSICHVGACTPCDRQSILKCECGANSQKFDCKDITSDRFKCKRRCNKKLSCGRHKCLNECCTDKEHNCKQTCGRKLDCGTHFCDEPCHSYCRTCPNIIWTEVYCNCGTQVLYPPLACSTKRPTCDKPCARVHSCPHPPTHVCHDDAECPPCTEFTSKMCDGGHEIMDKIPCNQSAVFCFNFCKKPLACGIHSCAKMCHAGLCPPCTQRCTKLRPNCQHPCGLPCHQSSSEACPVSGCPEMVKIYCKCKVKSEQHPCHVVNDARRFQAAVDNLLARYNFNATSVTLAEVQQMAHYSVIHQLDCDDLCSKEKRNKDLAEALGIAPGEPAHKNLPPTKYTEHLKAFAKSNPHIILNIHDKLMMLMKNYKKTNTKTMCYNFPPMNRISREIVHSYAAYFGYKTESVDQEPNRSVIVTAVKTSTVPDVSLPDAVGMSITKVKPKPMPVVTAKTSSEEAKDKKDTIDYFNFAGDD